MTSVIDFEIAKPLKEKGFDEKCSHYYIDDFQNFKSDGILHKCGLPDNNKNENILQFVKRKNQPHICNAPTISQVVMWLYKKHNLWISVFTMDKWLPNGNDRLQIFDYTIKQMKNGLIDIPKKFEEFDSIKETYQKAIKHCLNHLI